MVSSTHSLQLCSNSRSQPPSTMDEDASNVLFALASRIMVALFAWVVCPPPFSVLSNDFALILPFVAIYSCFTDWNGSKRGHVYKFLRSQGFVSSYDTAHHYTDADAHKVNKGQRSCSTVGGGRLWWSAAVARLGGRRWWPAVGGLLWWPMVRALTPVLPTLDFPASLCEGLLH
ncbi:hypothetical protein L3X38_026682 [Prunus dulcis]|uniref:Uncharacterized protein n=1 Tax=Prunus dulcis TaxID=3755 RepID=A0AAD4VNS5_PRUDU|nr:hypothetical protein L3X38_026682 [Prunus dulcis]